MGIDRRQWAAMVITCPVCGRSNARSVERCPGCGTPITVEMLMEGHARRLRVWQMVFAAAIVIGVLLIFVGMPDLVDRAMGEVPVGQPERPVVLAVASILFVGGLVGFLWARLATWYRHGRPY